MQYAVSFEGSGGAAIMEELIALGARAFLAIGSCGCLDAGIAEGHLIVPTAAYRDEGASYHYVAASDFVDNPAVRTGARWTKWDLNTPVRAHGRPTRPDARKECAAAPGRAAA